MGMFDTILFNSKSENVKCAHGHPQLELQTKDLDCLMDTYYVHNNKMFSIPRPQNFEDAQREEIWTEEGKALVLRSMKTIPESKFTGSLVAYNSCRKCDPVVYESPASWNHDKVDGHWPWVEVELVFQDGLLKEVKPVRVETRDDVRKEMLTNLGQKVLPDDDRVAKRFIEQHRK